MLSRFVQFIRNMSLVAKIGSVVAIVVVLAIGGHFILRGSPATAAVPAEISHVKLASVASLSSQTGPLPVTGKVASLSEAVILAQTSGEIVSLSHALGDYVSAGEVIAQFENSSQRASVLQAQGAYDAATAALAKAQGTTAQNSGVTATQAAQNAQTAQTSALAALQSAYASLDDAVHTKSDVLFSSPRSATPSLLITVPDSQLNATLINERSALEGVLASAHTVSLDTASADIDANIISLVAAAQTVATFETNLVQAVNEAVPNQSYPSATIAGYQTTIAAARTEATGAISSLTAAKSAYDSAISGAQTATNSASSGTASDIAAAQANVEEALGALNGAKANLEKTVVRSPISGTIVSLPITQGGYVSSFAEVADVSNPKALEIDAYVTSDDAKTLAVGGAAQINGTTKGVITSIAPALDPTTGEIEVKIGIPGDQSALTYGDTVTVTLTRSNVSQASGSQTSSNAIQIPIVAAKITPTGPVVFTVSSSTLTAVPVTLGDIFGDQVTVTAGLTPLMDIVTDARGLSDGQSVIVDTGN